MRDLIQEFQSRLLDQVRLIRQYRRDDNAEEIRHSCTSSKDPGSPTASRTSPPTPPPPKNRSRVGIRLKQRTLTLTP